VNDVVADYLCHRLFDDAERARWRMSDIAWQRIERERATPALCSLVREIAYSELTTTTATRRFLTELADDTDFTQWIAVWFYEETKHPQVLLRWLHHVGVVVDADFLARGRATAPFMRSRIGMLATNVISEMMASAGYSRIAEQAEEPVLADIARKLAADEARHAASFYAYAARHLERTRDLDGDRRDVLKVLYLWFQDPDIRHPVGEFYARNAGPMSEMRFDLRVPRERIVELIGTLIGIPLRGDSDLHDCLRDLGTPTSAHHPEVRG
jgi:hypothetical protein